MPSIAVDIDDTLYSFNQLARETFVEVALETGDKRLQRGAYCAWGEWRTPADVTDADVWMQIIHRCHEPETIARQVPFADAASTLNELADNGYFPHYISNRSPDAELATREWLEHWYFPPGCLTCTMGPKRPHIRDCQYLIDDRPKTLVEFVYDFHWKYKYGSEEQPRKGFGLYMPYNAALTDVPGIKLAPNWRLLRQYLIEQEVLSVPTPNQVVAA